ncbi:MAG: alpha/beta hydrolase, partial [Phycisphaerae bacterium]|nr:alpha/beta hydrolase [Phycisphaerae bacterium]
KRWASIFEAIKVLKTNYPEVFWRLLLWLLMRFAQPKLGRRFPSVRKALKEMEPRPILFIHGQRDSYIRVDQTELLHAAAPEPKYMWIVNKAKHNQAAIIAPDAYASRTVAFFDKHLNNEDVPESKISADPGGTEAE